MWIRINSGQIQKESITNEQFADTEIESDETE